MRACRASGQVHRRRTGPVLLVHAAPEEADKHVKGNRVEGGWAEPFAHGSQAAKLYRGERVPLGRSVAAHAAGQHGTRRSAQGAGWLAGARAGGGYFTVHPD